jgi:23S rRNA G2445 N2-methylase RlmL
LLQSCPGVICIGGDLNSSVLRHAAENCKAACVSAHLICWDAQSIFFRSNFAMHCFDCGISSVTDLPLKTSSVDVIISDIPWGVRHGSAGENRLLYPAMLQEMARYHCSIKSTLLILRQLRVIKPGGKAIILTSAHHIFRQALKKNGLWQCSNACFLSYFQGA